MSLLIQNGRVIDPSQGLDEVGHLLVEAGRVTKFYSKKSSVKLTKKPQKVLEASGLIVAPGLVDIHVHLREPGEEYKETIESGSRAALFGGFVSLACMANTIPTNDTASVTRRILEEVKRVNLARIYPIGAATKALKGETLSEMAELKRAGCVAVSDDGHVIQNAAVARKVMEYAATFDLPVISHAIDRDLEGSGVMNEGLISTELGLPGIPHAAEDVMIHRDIELARVTGARLHIAHISTRGGIRAVRAAKKEGVRVTCEVAPHHFTLTDEAVRGYQTHAKMSPPLRTTEDLKEIYRGLRDGTIDAIASDHAPHAAHEKSDTFCAAKNGIVGLETSLPLGLRLVEEGVLTLPLLIERMTIGPAQILGLDAGTLKEGARADIVIFDPEAEVLVDEAFIHSKSKNSPFLNWRLKGQVRATLVGGEVKYELFPL